MKSREKVHYANRLMALANQLQELILLDRFFKLPICESCKCSSVYCRCNVPPNLQFLHNITLMDKDIVIMILNQIRVSIYSIIIAHSKFRRHVRIREFLSSCSKRHGCGWKFENLSCVYILVNATSKNTYVGQSNRGFYARFFEHVKKLICPEIVGELPCYAIMRKRMFSWLSIPVYVNSFPLTNYSLRQIESRYIHVLGSSLNVPFIHQKITSVITGGRQKRYNRLCSKSMRGKEHCLRFCNPDFSESSVPLSYSIVFRLSERRKPATQLLNIIRDRVREQPDAIDRIFCNCYKLLQGKELQIAIQRLKRHIVHEDNPLNRVFKIPFVSQNEIGQEVRALVCNVVQQQLPAKRKVMIDFVDHSPPAIAELIKNTKKWSAQIIDCHSPCNCNQLRHILHIDPVKGEEHVCCNLNQTAMFDELPLNTSMKTRVYPSLNYYGGFVLQQLLILFWRIKISILGSDVNNFSQWLHSILRLRLDTGNFISMEYIQKWNEKLQHLGVIGPIDKAKESCFIMCPFLFRERMIKLWIGDPNVIVCSFNSIWFIDQVQSIITNFLKSGVHFKNWHMFGQLDGWAKLSGLYLKMRPLNSYLHHILRDLYSYGCKAISFMIEFCSWNRYSSTRHFKVIDKIRDFNIGVQQNHRKFSTRTMKRDVENFFNTVPRFLIRIAIRKVIIDVKGRGRYNYVIIPKKKIIYTRKERICRKHYRHSRQHMSSVISQPRMGSSRSMGKFFVSFSLDQIIDIIEADFCLNAGWFGSWLLHFCEGMPQGSPLSPGVADLVLCFLELYFYDSIKDRIKPYTILHFRWCDDIYISIYSDLEFYTLYTAALDYIIRSFFGLKNEDETSVVGMNIEIIDNILHVRAKSPNEIDIKRARFVHYLTNRRVSQKHNTLIGLFSMAIDRCNSPCAIIFAGQRMIREFIEFGYPIGSIVSVLHGITDRHVYMRSYLCRLVDEDSLNLSFVQWYNRCNKSTLCLLF